MKKTKLMLRISSAVLAASCFLASVVVSGSVQAQTSKTYGLFGSPQCTEWVDMSAEARFTWTRAFISSLSKGFQEIRRTEKQKFSNSEGVDVIVAAIDKHCAASPGAVASEAVGPFLH